VVYRTEHITEIVGGSFLQFHRDDGVEHLLTDSRRLIFPNSSIFFALPGPRRDGSQFVQDLYKRGVKNFVVSAQRDHASMPEANFIQVDSPTEALQRLASFHRSRFDIPVIGVTGSNGKTIVKEWLYQLLEDQFSIVRSPRSYNSQIGVPLSVWQMSEKNDLAIFEAGISQAAEMEKLEKMIKPTVGIFTNIGEAHSEGFESIENKIQEKLILFQETQVVIFCQDDPAISQALALSRSPTSGWTMAHPDRSLMGWGYDPQARVRIKRMDKTSAETNMLLGFEGHDYSLTIPFGDDASIQNAMHCICVLLQMEIPKALIQEKLQRLTVLAMRLEIKKGINRSTLINDSYSADLSSLRIALDFLGQQKQHPKKTVILSDFLQTGRNQKELYQEIARLLEQNKIDRLLAIGEEIAATRAAFEGVLPAEAIFYKSTDEFINNFHPSDFRDESILLKGARKFQFERIEGLLSSQVHQTVLEINFNDMAHNLAEFQRLLKPSTKMMVIVKAFAYGMGSYEIANFLQFQKVDYLAVAYADEAVELRVAGITIPIMVMNIEESAFPALLQYHIEPVIYSFRLLEKLDRFLKMEAMVNLPVHIEIETGMNRLGFSVEDMALLVGKLKQSSVRIQSVFSHLAASEEAQQDAFTVHQASLFLEATGQIQASFPYPFLKHLANSAAIIRHPHLQLDMVRLGIGLYGIDPENSKGLDLKEASTLKSTIAQIRPLSTNETVGYNRKGVAAKPITMATIRIGYADGYPRSLGQGIGKMWLKGYLVPTLGSICMDMTMVDISGVPDVKEGDEILIFGKELPVSQLARWAHTIPYEIVTGVSQRVKRIYFEQ
jgi:Alr-MurF fusion protein